MKPPRPATWTIAAVLRWARDFLQAKQISEPRAAAEVLLAHCLNCTRLDLYLRHDQPLTASELSCYKGLLKRRLAFEPTQYITGHQEFWSLDFLVSPACLIPRPETELLVEAVLGHCRQEGGAGHDWRIVDVGTGSGVLAVVLATELPAAQVAAVDRSGEALALARENARRHGVLERIGLVQGDLLEAFRAGAFEVIAANPPYVPTGEWAHLPREIRDYEPRLALDGGPDGLAVLRTLVAQAPRVLVPGGLLALEVGQGQASAVRALLTESGAFGPATVTPDFQRIERVVAARRLG